MKAKTWFAFLIISLLLLQSKSYAENLVFVIPSIADYEKIPTYIQYQNLIRDSLADLNIQIKFKPIPMMRHFDVVKNGEMDATLFDNPLQRPPSPEVLPTSFPILILKVKIIHRKKDLAFDKNKLEQHRGAFILSWYFVRMEMDRRKLKYIETGSIQQNIKMLLSKRIDYILASESVAKDSLEMIPLAKEELIIEDQTFLEIPVYFSINKKHAKLLPKIEKALKSHLQGNLNKYPSLRKALFRP